MIEIDTHRIGSVPREPLSLSYAVRMKKAGSPDRLSWCTRAERVTQ